MFRLCRNKITGTGEARPQHFIEDEIFHVLRSKTFHPAQQDFSAEGDFTSEFVNDKFRFSRSGAFGKRPAEQIVFFRQRGFVGIL